MTSAHRTLALPGFLLGFALSGFFDGILLHQILQWHHLLSAVRGEDLRFQMLADGYFHLFMYAVAAAGLLLLWRRRSSAQEGRSGGLLRFGLIGFGAWHAADAVLSHWVLGIHRIKWDAENPLLWDLGWLALFGLVPVAAAFLLRSSTAKGRAGFTALVVGAGLWAAQPPQGRETTTIVFAAAVPTGDALSRAMEVADDLVWTDGTGSFVVTGVTGTEALRLYAQGALLVTGGSAAPGCFAWTRPQTGTSGEN